jgi:hypothetical protein
VSISDQGLLYTAKRLGANEIWVAEDRVCFKWKDGRDVVFCRKFFSGDFYQGIMESLRKVLSWQY